MDFIGLIGLAVVVLVAAAALFMLLNGWKDWRKLIARTTVTLIVSWAVFCLLLVCLGVPSFEKPYPVWIGLVVMSITTIPLLHAGHIGLDGEKEFENSCQG